MDHIEKLSLSEINQIEISDYISELSLLEISESGIDLLLGELGAATNMYERAAVIQRILEAAAAL